MNQMDFINWQNTEDAQFPKKQEEKKNSQQKILEYQKKVVKAYDAKDNHNGYNFELNNKISVAVDEFADNKYKVYESIIRHFVKEYPSLNPDLWKWSVNNASDYMDRVYCVDRYLLISHPEFNYPESPFQVKIQIKACRYESRKLLLPVRKSIEHLKCDGKGYIQPRELSYLNNINVFVWYHWCPIREDVVIHALKEPHLLFKRLQLEKGYYTERIAGNPLRYGDEDKKVDVLYLDPTAEEFPMENLIFIHNPFLH